MSESSAGVEFIDGGVAIWGGVCVAFSSVAASAEEPLSAWRDGGVAVRGDVGGALSSVAASAEEPFSAGVGLLGGGVPPGGSNLERRESWRERTSYIALGQEIKSAGTWR